MKKNCLRIISFLFMVMFFSFLGTKTVFAANDDSGFTWSIPSNIELSPAKTSDTETIELDASKYPDRYSFSISIDNPDGYNLWLTDDTSKNKQYTVKADDGSILENESVVASVNNGQSIKKEIKIATTNTNDQYAGKYVGQLNFKCKAKARELSTTIMSGSEFNKLNFGKDNNSKATVLDVVLTDEKAPSNATITDISEAQDGGVVAWRTSKSSGNDIAVYAPEIVNDTTEYLYISTQRKGINPKLNFDSSNMFSNYYKLEYFISENNIKFDSRSTENMERFFYDCDDLFDTYGHDLPFNDLRNVKNMKEMFSEMDGFHFATYKTIDLRNYDLSNVENMSGMFSNSLNINQIYFPSGINKVTNMNSMFKNISELSSLDLTGFNTSHVTDMGAMFIKCTALSSLNLSSFDTSNVNNMQYMFNGCNNLTSLNVSNFNTANVKNMSGIFSACSKLTNLDISKWDTSNVTDMSSVFATCSGLTSLDISGWNTSNATTMESMFTGCSSLTTLDISGWDTSKVTNMYGMFVKDEKLRTIYVSDKWNTNNVTNSTLMFYGCGSLRGKIAYSPRITDKTVANYKTGYLTYKASSNSLSDESAPVVIQ